MAPYLANHELNRLHNQNWATQTSKNH